MLRLYVCSPPCPPRSRTNGPPQYEALRRVHLIPTGEVTAEENEGVNVNVFRNLDSPVSEGGENFSTGYVSISMSDELVTAMPDAHTDGEPARRRMYGNGMTGRSSCFAWRARS